MNLPEPSARPKHIAIIMDGNGRWAHAQGKDRLEGHRQGAQVVRDITTFCREIGVQQLTLYSFSVQNWTRPPDEVAGLMQLLEDYCAKERETLQENSIRLTTIGDLSALPESTRQALQQLIEDTGDNTEMTLTLAINYGGREEIVHAVRSIANDVKEKRLAPSAIDAGSIGSRLYTSLMSDPDLVIRTSGEIRISNFLLWQSAYSEYHFTKTPWPEFTREDLCTAMQDFAGRERRFGATSEQLKVESDEPGYVLGDISNLPEEEEGPC